VHYRSIRVHVHADVIFTRDIEDAQQRVPAYFVSLVHNVDSVSDLDRNALIADLAAQVDNWNSRGSGFVMERITNFVIVLTEFRPLCGSTYVPTPEWLRNKMAVVNLKNQDQLCFVYAILSALFPAARDPNRISHYLPYVNTLNVTGLTFPLQVRDVPKFEKLNPTISVNALCEGDDDGYVPIYQ